MVGLCLDAAKLVGDPPPPAFGYKCVISTVRLELADPLGGDEASLPGGRLRLLHADAVQPVHRRRRPALTPGGRPGRRGCLPVSLLAYPPR